MRLLLSKEPQKRPMAIQALQHAWFTEDERIALMGSIALNKIIAGGVSNQELENEHSGKANDQLGALDKLVCSSFNIA